MQGKERGISFEKTNVKKRREGGRAGAGTRKLTISQPVLSDVFAQPRDQHPQRYRGMPCKRNHRAFRWCCACRPGRTR
eukprot:2126323-Rhodomonas_salina.2